MLYAVITSVSYRTDTAPVVPMFTEIVKAGSGKVIIRWKKNVDYDIAGYRIYYGTREGVYDGIISAIRITSYNVCYTKLLRPD